MVSNCTTVQRSNPFATTTDISDDNGGSVNQCITVIDQVKQENQTFEETVDNRMHELSRLITPTSQTIDPEMKTIINNKKAAKKIATRNILIQNGMVNNNIPPPNVINSNETMNTTTLGSLLADSVDIPLVVKQFITKMLGDMLNKVVQVFKPSSISLPVYTETNTVNEEIKVEVCKTKKEITFWEESKKTRQKIVSLFFPTSFGEHEDLMTEFDKLKDINEALPFYNP